MKAKTMRNEVSPLDATYDELVCIKRDNQIFGDFWCLTDTVTVTITEQKPGEGLIGQVSVPVKTMRKIIEFLTTPQHVQK